MTDGENVGSESSMTKVFWSELDIRIHEAALGNLGVRFSAGFQVNAYGSWFGLVLDGNFEASTLLVDALWENSLRQFVEGEFAVAVPARDVVAFCDAASPQGLAELYAVVERVYPSADHQLLASLLKRTGSGWHPLP